MKDTVRPETLISEQERARRKKTVDFARGSVRLEGHFLKPETEKLNQRYINGELSQAEFIHEGLKGIYARLGRDFEAEMVK